MTNNFLIGAHVSAAGGVEKAIDRAVEIGANCLQIFSGSPRVWQRPNLAAINADKITSKIKENNLSPIFTHSLYLVNLASENPELIRKSTEALAFDLRFDAHLHGAGVVVHLGSHQGRGWQAVKEKVAHIISELLEHSPSSSHLLIENAAGQNGKIGGDLNEVRWLFEQIKSSQLGWCVDTCHAFAAGYSLGESQNSLIVEIERLNLAEKLACVHVNDSRDPFGSGRDRHENLGDGLIPRADLQFFLKNPLIRQLPLILEVPGMNKEGPDIENINRLKKLVE